MCNRIFIDSNFLLRGHCTYPDSMFCTRSQNDQHVLIEKVTHLRLNLFEELKNGIEILVGQVVFFKL